MATGPVKVVSAGDVPVRALGKGANIYRMITKSREGSQNLLLGYVTFEPGSDWHDFAYTHLDEVYYVLKGRMELQWSEKPQGYEWSDENRVEFKEGQAVFLPPGVRYRERCVGKEAAVFICVITPPVE